MSALTQQTEAWLELRRSKIGASDAPVIMQVSPWKTPYQLWEEKLGFRTNETTAAMRRGLEMEEAARNEFELQTGLFMFPDVIFHSEYDWMMASLDGIDIERKNIVEIKCPGVQDHECAMDGVIPQKYFPQLQHQMIVAGLDRSFYFSYNGKSSKVIEVELDAKYASELISREQEFLRCVSDLEAPVLTEKDYKVREDSIWKEAAKQWLDVHLQLNLLKDKEEELKKTLICMSSNSNCKGSGIKISKVIRKGCIDYRSIPELQSMNLERFRKEPVEAWRINTY